MLARSLSKQLFRPAAATSAFRAPLLRQFRTTPPALVVRPQKLRPPEATPRREIHLILPSYSQQEGKQRTEPYSAQDYARVACLQAVGDKIPSIELDHGFADMVKVDLAERCAGRKVILLGLPGAFTPC